MIYRWISLLLLVGLACGCRSTALPHTGPAAQVSPATVSNAPSPFVFGRDGFQFANQLVWEYRHDAQGRWVASRRQSPPDYALHCFGMVRATRLFLQHARFDGSQPKTDTATYHRLVRKIIGRSPNRLSASEERVVIPGYVTLQEFSREQEPLLKADGGGAWRSYLQARHWRILLPFPRSGQEKTAYTLQRRLAREQWPPAVHLVKFPQLTINHAVLLYGCRETADTLEFEVYDPNKPQAPTSLSYHKRDRTFYFPENFYFPGGPVNVNEIYRPR